MCAFRKGGGVYLAQGVRLPKNVVLCKDAKTDMSASWFLGLE